jgi:hypothetical protein
MKTLKPCLFIILFCSLLNCENEENSTAYNNENLNLATIKKENSVNVLVNVELKSKQTNKNPIGCYVFESSIFDMKRNGYGYCSCDSMFIILNPLTGDTLNIINIEGLMTTTCIDTTYNNLIGLINDVDSSFIVTYNLDSGKLISKEKFSLGNGFSSCTYFYSQLKHELNIINGSEELISINPNNSQIVNSKKIDCFIQNVCFNEKTNRLYGLNYSQEVDSNYIVALDVKSGNIISKVSIKEKNNYHPCNSAFDQTSNCFIIVNEKNEVLFINSETGIISERYIFNFDIGEFKIWKSKI